MQTSDYCEYCWEEFIIGDKHCCDEYVEFLKRSIEICRNSPEIIEMIRRHATQKS